MGGLFLVKGLPIFVQLAFAVLLGLGFVCARNSKPHSAILSFLSLCLASLLLFQPWDELFIYLKHSENLAHYGTFSFKFSERVDGIVDFLPFFLMGLLHKLGLPLLEMNLVFGVLGGWLCILVFRRFLIEWNIEAARSWGYFIPLLYPPLLLNSGAGFSVLLFSASILWSLYFLFYRPQSLMGPLLLSLVPLIRLEGIFLIGLVFFRFFLANKKKENQSRHLGALLAVSLTPSLILLTWKWFYFGSLIPIPVIYKSSFGNLFYSLLGTRNLLMDLIATGGLAFCFIIFSKPTKPFEKGPFWILVFFCLPYYLSGGDWFPPALGRYLFPFSFFTFAVFIKWLFELKKEKIAFSSELFFATTLVFISSCFPFFSGQRVVEGLFTHRTSLSGIHQKKWGKVNFRIQILSQLGNHLAQTTPENAVIGSSEIATIMFFAKREALDLLGVTNKEIAKAPLRKAPHYGQKFTKKNELPFLIFKRLNPELLFKERPYIFYAFDFIPQDLIEFSYYETLSIPQIRKALLIWERKFQLLNTTLFGGINKLMGSGYEPVLVRRGKDFYSLYFVSSENKEGHFNLLKDLGFKSEMI